MTARSEVPEMDWLMDVPCFVEFVIGGSSVTVRDCLDFEPNRVLRLSASAGGDLQMCVEGVAVARGEVVIIEDQTALRITHILPPPGSEAS